MSHAHQGNMIAMAVAEKAAGKNSITCAWRGGTGAASAAAEATRREASCRADGGAVSRAAPSLAKRADTRTTHFILLK